MLCALRNPFYFNAPSLATSLKVYSIQFKVFNFIWRFRRKNWTTGTRLPFLIVLLNYHLTKKPTKHSVIEQPSPFGLPPEFTLMPRHFKNHGYMTHMVGK